jgi:hypothetical protein
VIEMLFPSRRQRAAALIAAQVTVLAWLAGACSSQAASPAAAGTPRPQQMASASQGAGTSPGSSPAAGAPGASRSPAARQAAGLTVIPVPPPPGRLQQTRAFPSARTRVFRAEMTDLWAAIVTGRPALARQAFCPLTAYEQVKAIADPAADWHSRLMGDFILDVHAAHRFLGQGARRARLVKVIVPSAEASWIVPGACYNSVGYWHVAGPRVVYRQHGQLRSIGIASLISWRGRWYVVHFGAVLRAAVAGVVDAPAIGPGTPGPAGGC